MAATLKNEKIVISQKPCDI